MYRNKKTAVIIPALNEEAVLDELFQRIPRLADSVICVDNGSTDRTYDIIRKWSMQRPGVIPAREPRRGYGYACLKGMEQLTDEDITVFLDADLSDDPERLPLLLDPIISGAADFVVSNRFTPALERGAMSIPQYFGNKLSVFLIRCIWGYPYRDLGPFRAVKTRELFGLGMEEKDYGWTVEMQVKVLKQRLSVAQVDLPYHRRNRGTSKVSRTIRGIFRAGKKILSAIFRLAYSRNSC
jgi:glycosyltransferase involved in cell wall biosynthesis